MINGEAVVYHQRDALYLINSAGIASHQAAEIHGKAVMTYRPAGG